MGKGESDEGRSVTIAGLINELRVFKRLPNVFNPWSDTDAMDNVIPELASMHRCLRLSMHLRCPDPRIILVGEAPGYQGCHFSGIPFTNEKLLLAGKVPRVRVDERITSRRLPWCEPSATIMWGALHEHGLAEHTVMWNAFAFHPHKPGEVYSNRTPTMQEFLATRDILKALIELYPGCAVVAVGRQSSANLKWLGISHAQVRHPSMGGANEFRAGLKEHASRFT